jgi:hypothetical protein
MRWFSSVAERDPRKVDVPCSIRGTSTNSPGSFSDRTRPLYGRDAGLIPAPGSSLALLAQRRQDRTLRRAPGAGSPNGRRHLAQNESSASSNLARRTNHRPFSLVAQSSGPTHRDPGFESLKGYHFLHCVFSSAAERLPHMQEARGSTPRRRTNTQQASPNGEGPG